MFCKQLTHVIDLFYAVRENIPSTGQKDWKILSFCREKKSKQLYSSHAHRPNQSSFSNVIEKPQSIINPIIQSKGVLAQIIRDNFFFYEMTRTKIGVCWHKSQKINFNMC